MSDEQHSIHLEHLPEVQPKLFVVSEELQKALKAAVKGIEDRSFSGRNPHLGKMIKCQPCGRRHRENEKKCEQVFTYRVGDYELWREDEEGNKTPAYRTAIDPNQPPTKKQVVGAAAFAKKRFRPHHSKIKLQFIERTRVVFKELGFDVDSDKEVFEKNLQVARVEAARQLRKERRAARNIANRRRQLPGRILRGLEKNGESVR
jgi:hypothetical protein